MNAEVTVFNNNVDAALKVLRKSLVKHALFAELKNRAHYRKPSEQKRLKRARALARRRKNEKRRGEIIERKPKSDDDMRHFYPLMRRDRA